jgi:two-component system, cell cycle response regulator
MTGLHRILIVDDDIAVRMRVRDLLEKPGSCEVLEASDGLGGLALASEHRPDVILLDIMMPGLSGLDVCERLRAEPITRDIPIIILSAGDEQQSMPDALRAGAEDYLAKPIPSGELRAKVGNILRLDRFRSLNRKQRRLSWLVEHSREALVIIDHAGLLVEANQEARRLFGLPETPGVSALAFIEAHYQPDPPDAFSTLRSRGYLPGRAFSLCRPEHSLAAARWLDVGLFADEHDAAGELVLKFTDRTAAVQRELETWSFQHMMSHKIRTPLNGMSSLIELLAGSPSIRSDPGDAELIDIVLTSARRLEDTLISILKYNDALHAPRPTYADGAKPPDSWDELISHALGEADFPREKFHLAGEPSALPDRSLAHALHLGLVEVIENYRKFSDAPVAGLHAEFRVTDGLGTHLRLSAPGPALPPDTIALLGRPYWQMENRFSGEVPGVGLGLATARTCLRSLGADLRFSALGEPSGLAVDFILPPPAP